MKDPWQPDVADVRLVDVLEALADSTRLEMVTRLADGRPQRCAAILEDAALHKSTLSHHYRVLREAGVTHTDIEGRERWISLRRDDLDSRFPGLLDSVLRSQVEAREQRAPGSHLP